LAKMARRREVSYRDEVNKAGDLFSRETLLFS
jgi:hypothetical protein